MLPPRGQHGESTDKTLCQSGPAAPAHLPNINLHAPKLTAVGSRSEQNAARLAIGLQQGSSALGSGMRICAHRALLSQAVSNLLDNAIKYGRRRITVRTAARGETVAISVADSGPGIPMADRDKVLERFYRADASRSSPGSGLGLSLVRAVARLHDAALTIEDNCPGVIATLTFPTARAERRRIDP